LLFVIALYIRGLEKALQRERAAGRFIEDVLNSINEGVVVVDRNFRITSANKAFYEHAPENGDASGSLVKRGGGKTKTRHCFEISHGINKPCYETGVECPVKRSFESGEPCTVVHRHNDVKGKPAFLEIKSYPMKDDSGTVCHVVATSCDITGRVQNEDRTMLNKKMEALSSLTGGVAHNFNNLLAAIVCYGSLLKMKIKDDDCLSKYVDRILEVSDKAACLTHNLLACSNNSSLKPQPVRVNEIVRESQSLVREVISDKIELKMALTEMDSIAMADIEQIEKMLLNLVHNAKEAMYDGGVLTIETSLVELGREYVESRGYGNPGTFACISVTDTGRGIDEKIRERIFDPFFTTKEVGKGPGLGLPASYGIIRQHNGYIDCESEEGKGTTFRICLPVLAFDNDDVSQISFETA